MFYETIKKCINYKKDGISMAIPSYCTSNLICIEAILNHYREKNIYFLIEATSNQVNQYGGYTGMTPLDYIKSVYNIADKINFNREKLMLGGDHLGPLPWSYLKSEEAMRNAHKLVYEYVLAGYEKIHIDTSIRLKDDPENISDELIAERGVSLYQTCIEASKKLELIDGKKHNISFIIGSEVPPAGGNINESIVNLTSPESLRKTLKIYDQKFHEVGINNAWDKIVGVVVQPGVEYGCFSVHQYNRKKARDLCEVLDEYNICFEGHSTDFQFPSSLRNMAEDGIKILKVGPSITYALREALINMCEIEKNYIKKNKRSHFKKILDRVMKEDPKYWNKYYIGTDEEIKIKRKYSYFDRSRYYMSNEKILNSLNILESNLNNHILNPCIIHQYFRNQYDRLYRNGEKCDFYNLIYDFISMQLEEYDFAVRKHNIEKDL